MASVTGDIHLSPWFAFFSTLQSSAFPFSYKQLTTLLLLKIGASKTPLQLTCLSLLFTSTMLMPSAANYGLHL